MIFTSPTLTKYQIEKLAREQGMIYPQETLPFSSNDKGGERD